MREADDDIVKSSPPSGARVLLVDDDPGVLSMVSRAFTEAGFSITTASTGAQAIDLVKSETFDLLVIDWGLPDRSGLEVIAAARAAGEHAPVLVLTGRSAADDTVEALDSGADDFVTKGGVPTRVMVSRAKALLRRVEPKERPRRFEVASLVVDERARSVTLDGQPIEVSTPELRFLAMLAARPGKVIPRELLTMVLWGPSATVSDNALHSIVKRLRKKLGNFSGRLRSVRLRGYVLVIPPP